MDELALLRPGMRRSLIMRCKDRRIAKQLRGHDGAPLVLCWRLFSFPAEMGFNRLCDFDVIG